MKPSFGPNVLRAIACACLAAITMAGCAGGGGSTAAPTGSAAPQATLFSLADGTAAGFGQATGLAVSRDGRRLFFSARRLEDDAPAIYRLDLTTQAVTQLHAGAPLVEPGAIATTPDNRSLLITDLAAPNGETSGTVFKLPVTGLVAPASILAPDTVDLPGGIAIDGSGRQVFVSGYDVSGVATIFATDVNGSSLRVVASGEPLADPAALTLSPDEQSLLVVDTAADQGGAATVFRVKLAGGSIETLARGIAASYPAGIAADSAGTEAFVTGRTPEGKPAVIGVTLDHKVVRTVIATDARSEPTAIVQSPVSAFVLYLADADGPGGTGNILTIFR